MRIVIKISDKLYDLIKNYERSIEIIEEENDTLEITLMRAIIKGEPLPEHHGRLIDGDKAIADFANYGIDHMWDATDLPYIIDESPTIIDADKESDTE